MLRSDIPDRITWSRANQVLDGESGITHGKLNYAFWVNLMRAIGATVSEDG
jgi:hypothetical protein